MQFNGGLQPPDVFFHRLGLERTESDFPCNYDDACEMFGLDDDDDLDDDDTTAANDATRIAPRLGASYRSTPAAEEAPVTTLRQFLRDDREPLPPWLAKVPPGDRFDRGAFFSSRVVY